MLQSLVPARAADDRLTLEVSDLDRGGEGLVLVLEVSQKPTFGDVRSLGDPRAVSIVIVQLRDRIEDPLAVGVVHERG